MFVIKNVSFKNIIIGKKQLSPNEEIPIQNLNIVQNYINSGDIKVLNDENTCDFKYSKDEITSSLFKFYLNENLSEKDFEILIYFFKQLGFSSKISLDNLNLLNDINNREELIEILLNNIYGALIDYFLNKKK